MLILGIDQGLAHCGLALLDGDEVIATRLIETLPEDGDEAQRVQDVARAVEQFMDERDPTNQVVVVAIEQLHFQQVRYKHAPTTREYKAEAAKAAKMLRVANVAGAIMHIATWHTVIEVQPSRAKKALTDNAKASKQQVKGMAAQMAGVEPSELSEHEADAVAIAEGAKAVLKDRKLKELAERSQQTEEVPQ